MRLLALSPFTICSSKNGNLMKRSRSYGHWSHFLSPQMASVNPLPCSGQTPLKHNEITLNAPLSSLFSPISSLLSLLSYFLSPLFSLFSLAMTRSGQSGRGERNKREKEKREGGERMERKRKCLSSRRRRRRERSKREREGRRGGEIEIVLAADHLKKHPLKMMSTLNCTQTLKRRRRRRRRRMRREKFH